MNQLHGNLDLYSNSPLMYWYESNQYIDECYVKVWRRGREFIGYLHMPDYSMIEQLDLRYVGFGDMQWIEERGDRHVQDAN